jgi:hypothetical protein
MKNKNKGTASVWGATGEVVSQSTRPYGIFRDGKEEKEALS